MAAYFSCHKVKNTWVASSVCCLSALSMRQSFSLERDRDTDHALDQHSTLRRPSPHFIALEQPLRLVKCPLSRCSHEPLVLTLHFSTDPIIPMRLTPWRGLVSSLLFLLYSECCLWQMPVHNLDQWIFIEINQMKCYAKFPFQFCIVIIHYTKLAMQRNISSSCYSLNWC